MLYHCRKSTKRPEARKARAAEAGSGVLLVILGGLVALVLTCAVSFALLFMLHSPVLKPDFYLSFSQLQAFRDFLTSLPCQVLVVVEFLFQFQCLIS